MRLLNSEDRILHSYLKGHHLRAFKHRSEEGDERIKGLDRICFGVESFCRDGSGDDVPYDFHSELFRPDYIVTDLTREEVVRKSLEELKGKRDDEISHYRNRGWLVGEEVENSQIEIIADAGSE
jgi:hypothetical protein